MARLLLIAGLAACRAAPEPSTETGTLALCVGCDATCAEEFAAPASSAHVPGGITYADPPPSSGDHDPCWARWGVHTEAVPDELWVHNLEHGGVVFLYDCPDGCADEVAELTALAGELETFVLLSPYDELPTRFAAVSWGWRYLTDCFARDDFEAFYLRHFDRAPESIPTDPGALCP